MNLKAVFIELMCESGMLRFGNFKTKAGRDSPYFINAGAIHKSDHLKRLGEVYAEMICEKFAGKTKHLFGPAYKGIPLCNITAFALAARGELDYMVTFNRKEIKDHGEGGQLVGAALKPGESVIIIEDVVSRGTSVAETIAALSAIDVRVEGLLVGVDRMEKGYGKDLASFELRQKHNVQVESVVTLDEIIEILQDRSQVHEKFLLDQETLDNITKYRQQWG